MNWLNLYVQTEYSLLKSSIRIPELKEFAKANNFRAMAICDENMAGVFKFYLSAIKANIKPIIGLSKHTYFS
ncbi:MAG TPA: PHP domain-containing protein [Bacilli bacterium]|nr:PHP domain-containing protein [Bacilli bacterium]